MTRSSLFEKETIRPDDLKLAYHSIFGKTMKDRNFRKTLSYLEKIGIIYCQRRYRDEIESIMIPDFIYSIEREIEAKLPEVFVAEEKEES